MVSKDNNEKVNITSPQQCHHEFDLLKITLQVEETEDSWLKIDASLKRFTAAVRGGACDYPDDFVRRWKETDIVRGVVGALSTERTRLSGTALDLLGSTARLGSHWDSAIPFYIPTIIKLLGRASRIYVTRASIALNTLIRGTKSASFVPLLLDGLNDKSVSMRVGCADAILCCLGGSPERDRDQLELIKEPALNRDGLNKRVVDIENAIKIGGRDRDPKVRAICKRIWDLYQRQWPVRAATLLQPLTPTIRRYLGIGKAGGMSSNSHHTYASSSTAPVVQPYHNNRHRPQGSAGEMIHTTSTHAVIALQERDSQSKLSGRPPGVPSKQTSWMASNAHRKVTSSEIATCHSVDAVPPSSDNVFQPQQHNHAQLESARLNPTLHEDKVEDTRSKSYQPGITKRSNSIMRASRVDPPTHGPSTIAAAKISRTATRAPIHLPHLANQTMTAAAAKLSTTGNPNPPKKPSSMLSVHEVGVSNPISGSNRGFRPSRTASGSIQVIPTTHRLQTRPLPRRTVAPPTSEAHPELESQSTNLKKSTETVVLNARKDCTEASGSNTARKGFKPSKSLKTPIQLGKKIPHHPALSITSLTTASHSTLDKLPEELRIPALTPLPPSPLPSASSTFESKQLTEVNAFSDSKARPVLLTAGLDIAQGPNPVKSKLTNETSDITLTTLRKDLSSLNLKGVQRKICTRLPDDLIVPMSVPLPPSPTSPYFTRTLKSQHSTSRGNFSESNSIAASCLRKSRSRNATPKMKTPPSQRPRADFAIASSSLSKSLSFFPGERDSLKTNNISPFNALRPSSAQGHQHSTVNVPHQSELLVDFDHEDTIWVPPPPKLISDLVALAPAFDFARWQEEFPLDPHTSDEGQDGPEEKRMRLDIVPPFEGGRDAPSTSKPAATATSTPIFCDPACEGSLPPQRTRPRDPSIFHWDRLSSADISEDSNDKTISCLKEQPLFLAGDVTVNDDKSFGTDFLLGIHRHNQSTPVCAAPAMRSNLINVASLQQSLNHSSLSDNSCD